MNTRKRITRLLAGTALLPLALAGCGGGGEAGDAAGTIEYTLWDSNQLPAYQACADAFTEANPDLTVEIRQLGWDDYWSNLTTGFVAGTAPDVFTNHLAYYPQFANQGVLMPLNDLVEEAGIDVEQYQGELEDLWVSPEGERYGLPKDFDTIALFYNKQLLADAGVGEDQLATLTWNPQDGGTYEDLIAHLTIDANGVRGDEPGFDKNNVAVYGLGLEDTGNGVGQTQWSHYAVTNGWQVLNENPWGTEYNYDDPKLHETIAWWRSLIDKGYMPPLEVATSGGASNMNDQFGAGKIAMATTGSWLIGQLYGYEGVQTGVAPLPIGPSGQRASMFNGLADSIYADTDNPEGAKKWVQFLASEECQRIVGEAGVVFPALPEATEVARAAFEAKGVNVDPFLTHVEEGTTFLYPITDHASDIDAIMAPTMDRIMSFDADPSVLAEANEQVNALFD